MWSLSKGRTVPNDPERLTLFYLALWKLVDIHFPGHQWLESISESKPDLLEEVSSYLKSDPQSWTENPERIKADADRALKLVGASEIDPGWIVRADELRRSFQESALRYSKRLGREELSIPVLDWFEKHELRPETMYVDQLIGPVISRAVERAKSKGTLVIAQLGEKLGPVRVDPEGFLELFSNLLFNAIDASKKGDSIRVEAHSDQHQVLFLLTQEMKGLDTTAVSNLFTPFFNTKKGGTGLGLAVASRLMGDIVHRLGGRLSFTAEPGRGRAVALSLPLVN